MPNWPSALGQGTNEKAETSLPGSRPSGNTQMWVNGGERTKFSALQTLAEPKLAHTWSKKPPQSHVRNARSCLAPQVGRRTRCAELPRGVGQPSRRALAHNDLQRTAALDMMENMSVVARSTEGSGCHEAKYKHHKILHVFGGQKINRLSRFITIYF